MHRHLPEEIEKTGTQEDRIVAEKGARETILAAQEKHGALSNAAQHVRTIWMTRTGSWTGPMTGTGQPINRRRCPHSSDGR